MHALSPVAKSSACSNLNHSRGANALVAHCPDCGKLVNGSRAVDACPEPKHAAARRRQTAWCTDCGSRLIATFLK